MASQIIPQTDFQNQYENLFSKIKIIEDQQKDSNIATLLNLSTIQNQITELTSKLDSTSLNMLSNKSKIEKIDDFISFISKTNDVLTTHEIRINLAIKEISNAKYKYDKIIIDNLHVPGFIGDYCKYKNLKEYLDFNIKEMFVLNSFKQKNEMDLKTYKVKLENMMVDFQRQISSFANQQKTYSENVKKEAFDYIDQCRNDFYDKYDEILIVNSKYSYELKDKANKMQGEWEKILQIKNEINARIDKTLEDIKNENNKTLDIFKFNNNEFARIKSKFSEMVEFIKDVRFRKNLAEVEIKKREINHLTEKLQFNKKRRIKDIVEAKPLDLNYDVFTGKEVQTSDEIDKEEESQKYFNEDRPSQKGKRRRKDFNYSLSPNKRTPLKVYPKSVNENSNVISNISNISNKNNIKPLYNVDNSFKEKNQSSNNNSDIQLMKNRIYNESRNYRILQRQISVQSIGDVSPKQNRSNLNKKWRNNSNKVNEPINAMNSSSIKNNHILINTVDITTYNFQHINHQLKPKMKGLSSIIKQPAEGKVITLHFRDRTPSCIHRYENRDQILALKPSNFDKKHVGFSTSKEYDKVIDKVFLSTTPQILLNAKTKNNPMNQSTSEKRNRIKKELLGSTRKNKLKYETINKVLTVRPKSQIENKEEKNNKSLDFVACI